MSNEWNEYGHVDLPDILTPSSWDDILTESRELQSEAKEYGFEVIASHRDGSFASQSRYAGHHGGPALQELLRSRELLAELRRATGLGRLIPVRCGYNYYRRGDFMGLHRDSVKASITLSFDILGNLPPMGWAPDLRTAPNDKLGQLVAAEGIFPPSLKDSFSVGHRQIRGFDGYNIPHWRSPFEAELGILGNLCYFDL